MNVAYILLGLSGLGILFSALLLVRNEKAFNIREVARNAIFRYKVDILCRCVDSCDHSMEDCIGKVDYSDIESYYATVFKFWHNSWRDVLPHEKVALLEPYVKEGSE